MFTAYLKARSVLPHPYLDGNKVFIISVGDEPGIDCDVHISDIIPTGYFIFILMPDRNRQMHVWKCLDEEIILNLNDNKRICIECLSRIMN